MRVIDADALGIYKFKTNDAFRGFVTVIPFDLVMTAPTIDAVPVVRCKDCMFARKVDSRREPKWKCVHSIWEGCTQWRESNFYCAYGEKKSAKMDLEEENRK